MSHAAPRSLTAAAPNTPEIVPVGLRYVDDTEPGYTRRRCGKGFAYLDPSGRPLRDRAEIARLQALVVPPAWTRVWYCTDPRGHIQATGRDARGRKQYRYHPEWTRVRDEVKFDALGPFGTGLGLLRRHLEADMAARTLSFERVAATTVWLLDHTLIRIGNDEYARDGSYGLTTLLDEHVEVGATRLVFRFVGKSGKEHDVELADRRVAKTVARCQDLPGQHLFQYLDQGQPRAITSRDVNDYLRRVMDAPFTAKTFRTWGGSVHALRHLAALDPPSSAAEARRQISAAVKATARELRNTPAVCRRSYVHPRVFEAHAAGALHDPEARAGGARPRPEAANRLSPAELDLLALLTAP